MIGSRTIRTILLCNVAMAPLLVFSGCQGRSGITNKKPSINQRRWDDSRSALQSSLGSVLELAKNATDRAEREGWDHQARGYRQAIEALYVPDFAQIRPTPYNVGFGHSSGKSNRPLHMLIPWVERENDVIGVRFFDEATSFRFESFAPYEYVDRTMLQFEYLHIVDSELEKPEQFDLSGPGVNYIKVPTSVIGRFSEPGAFKLVLILKDGTESESTDVFPLVKPETDNVIEK